MTRLSVFVAVAVALAAVSFSVADDPVKGKPDAQPKDAKKDDQDPEKAKKAAADDEEAKKTKELVVRIAKGMERSETRLGDKKPDDVTQQVQRDVVKDLDELIEKMKKQQD